MSNGEPRYWNTILFVLYSFILRNCKQNKRKTHLVCPKLHNEQQSMVFQTVLHQFRSAVCECTVSCH